MLNCFKRFLPACALVTSIGTGIYVVYKENIKTLFRLREKIYVDLPENYVPKSLESTLSNLLRNPGIQGVHILYEPAGSGKTTAIKKVLKDIQDENHNCVLTLYTSPKNQKIKKTYYLKPIYVDLKTDPLNWENDFGSNGRYLDTIPENMKVVIVLDHMGRNIIDGFDDFHGSSSSIGNTNARNLFSCYATSSYNAGYNYVIIIVTNDREYAKNILQCNGCQKVHQICTNNDINGRLHTEAMIESSKKLDKYLQESK